MNEVTFIIENIITSSNEVFKDIASDITVGYWAQGNSTWVTVKRYIIVSYISGS